MSVRPENTRTLHHGLIARHGQYLFMMDIQLVAGQFMNRCGYLIASTRFREVHDIRTCIYVLSI